jgi:hypothetical protein
VRVEHLKTRVEKGKKILVSVDSNERESGLLRIRLSELAPRGSEETRKTAVPFGEPPADE